MSIADASVTGTEGADGALLQRLDELLATRTNPASQLWVGFSGGMDSCVLLHLLALWWQQGGASSCAGLHAIHVHHGLMTEADDWAGFCSQQCQALGIPLTVERVHLGRCQDGIEQAARRARYEVFQRYCQSDDWLLLGHHADDQVETLFNRLTRGSGLSGLAGMPQQRYLSSARRLVERSDNRPGEEGSPRLLRPLLDCSRQQLLQYAQAHRLHWVDDPSNQDTRLERNWWRQVLLPELYRRFPGREHSLKRTARRLAADKAAFDHLLAPVLELCTDADNWPGNAGSSLDIQRWQDQPKVLHEPLLYAWLQHAAVEVASETRLAELVEQALYAAADAQIVVELGDVQVRRFRGRLYLVLSDRHWPVTVPARLALTLPDTQASATCCLLTRWSLGELVAEHCQPAGTDSAIVLLSGDYQLTCQAHLELSHALLLRPPGRPSKSLKQLWQEAGIPPWLRPHWPLLLQHERLVAVAGIAADQSVIAGVGQPGYRLVWQSCPAPSVP
jgi:tRNA(Ile)-lysidine synthase